MSVKQILFRVLLCSLLFLLACRGKEHGNNETNVELDVDSTDARGTYLKIRGFNQPVVDKLYESLLRSLCSANKYDLMEQHLSYYKKIAGKGTEAKAIIAKSDGLVYNYLSKYDSSKYFFNKAVALFSELNAQKDVADCYYDDAMNYYYEGDYSQSYTFDYKALLIYEKLNDFNDVYKIKTEIGNYYLREDEYDSAISVLLVCQDYFKKHSDSPKEAYVVSLLGQAYYGKGNLQMALNYTQASLAENRGRGDQLAISGSLNNLAAIYLDLKQWDKALSGFNESLAILRQQNEVRHIPNVKRNIATCLWQMGHVKEAEEMANEVIDSAKQKKQEALIASAYKLLYNINKTNKNYKAAMEAFRQYKIYDDSVFNIEKTKVIDELNIKYETKKKEAQIVQLNADKKVDALKKRSYLLTLFFIGLISLLVILLMANHNKKNKLILEKVQLDLEAKARELAVNTRELNTFTESVLSKNKIIEELEQKLRDKMRETEFDENNEQLSQLYQLKILTEDDWRQFKILFDKVYPGIISRLRERYPDLSPSEERQFLLTKLKIDNKESADMLGISILSVKKNRYRLKKRFNLTEGEDLDEFVWKFESKAA